MLGVPRGWSAAAAAALVLALAGYAPPSAACTCLNPFPTTVPQPGETVPRNAALWLSYVRGQRAAWLWQGEPEVDYPDAFEVDVADVAAAMAWRGPDGTAVPYRLTALVTRRGDVFFFVARPKQLLEPGDHEFGPFLEGPYETDELWEKFAHLDGPHRGDPQLRFRVSNDLAPPPVVPRLVRQKPVSVREPRGCDGSRYTLLDLSREGLFTVLDVNGRALGAPAPYAVNDVFVGVERAFVGIKSQCSSNYSFDRNGPATVRLGAFNIAGEFSGWSPRFRVELPPPGYYASLRPSFERPKSSCGCRFAGDNAPLVPWLLPLLPTALCLRRRRGLNAGFGPRAFSPSRPS